MFSLFAVAMALYSEPSLRLIISCSKAFQTNLKSKHRKKQAAFQTGLFQGRHNPEQQFRENIHPQLKSI